ncbi:response regulator transcription factor [Aneurinibacillus uraniidurans]|uniref:response regulator transcription factor n=1 Tax=Aneurinibacillus uraniidurans TaxID=2966586 RepID=UPI00234932C3|nr:response regulator transcription factor [Aneurinibacillus sp. B1]WCN36265.1 response regulator transcription factor [Aneurinibacillus sp. B1]
MRVLVVEDDLPLRRIISKILEEEQYEVDQAENGEEGYLRASLSEYDLLVLDVMMPIMDGFSLIKKLRREGYQTPTLFLTAKDRIEDKVQGLNSGADDYIVKPFATEEFLARVQSLLRRAGKIGMEGKLTYGPILVDTNQHEGFINDTALKLTIKEYELLFYFIQNKEQILTRDQIFQRVWGMESETTNAIVDLYIHYLRKKLAPFEYDRLIRTVRGVGYMLKE